MSTNTTLTAEQIAQHRQLMETFREAGMPTLNANTLARSIVTGTINQQGIERLAKLIQR